MIQIQYNYQYTDKNHPNWIENGGTDENRDALIEWDRTMVSWYPALGQRQGDIVKRSLAKLEVSDFMMLIGVRDGDVSNYNPWVKVAEADLQNIVPEGLPERLITVVIDDTDPEKIVTEQQSKTWYEWGRGFQTREQTESNMHLNIIEGYAYFKPTNGNRGKYLSGAELVIIHQGADSELVREMPIIENYI